MTNEAQTHRQYLSFFIEEEEYAVPILRVKEIIEYTNVTRVPNMPACFLGVINLRGKVVPVVDLAIKFSRAARPITKWSYIVIIEMALEHERANVGLLADRVSQVVELPSEKVEPPPSFGTTVRGDYLLGMGQAEGKFLLLLNMDRLLSPTELLASERLEARVSPDAVEASAAATGNDRGA